MQVVSETTNATETWLEKILPVLRARRLRGLFGLGSGQAVVALFKDKIVLGRTRKPLPIGDAEATPEELEGQLCGQLRRRRVIPLASVSAVAVERPRFLSPNLCRFRLTAPSGAFRFVIFRREVGNFLRALQGLLGDRVVLERRVRFHTWAGTAIALFLLLGMAVGLAAWLCPISLFEELGLEGWAPIALLLCLSPLFLFILAYIFLAHYPGKQLQPGGSAPKPRSKGDLSRRSPFRSRVLGWTVKALAAAWLLALWFCRAQILQIALMTASRLGLDGQDPWFFLGAQLALWLSIPPALLLLYMGYLLSLNRPDYVRKSDARPPILYLRSFLDDRKTDLHNPSLLAEFLGVQSFSNLPLPWRYILLFHPIRIIRLFFGIAVDTSEEQLGAYFRKFGPFVAIGKPGERFATSGASRMYVSNETWQQTVMDLLAESQIVVLQPAKTEGIWWEVQKTAAAVEPQRLLICLVNFYRRQDDYETFRLKIDDSCRAPFHAGSVTPTLPASCTSTRTGRLGL
jgi:hypothetical protein